MRKKSTSVYQLARGKMNKRQLALRKKIQQRGAIKNGFAIERKKLSLNERAKRIAEGGSIFRWIIQHRTAR